MSELRSVRVGTAGKTRRGTFLFLGLGLFGLLVLLLIPVLHTWDGNKQPEAAADFTLKLFDGGTFRLSDHKGAPVVINFFASWCTVCGSEAGSLENVYREYSGQRVVFLGVAIEDVESKARDYVKRYGLTFGAGLDVDGTIKQAYRIHWLPITYFIDREGLVNYVHAGVLTEDLLSYELAKIL